LLAWGIFGAIAFIGWVLSFGITGAKLESEEFFEDHEPEHDDEETGGHHGNNEDNR
jgi:hypothetical protein